MVVRFHFAASDSESSSGSDSDSDPEKDSTFASALFMQVLYCVWCLVSIIITYNPMSHTMH